jgi:hypothetical protein
VQRVVSERRAGDCHNAQVRDAGGDRGGCARPRTVTEPVETVVTPRLQFTSGRPCPVENNYLNDN